MDNKKFYKSLLTLIIPISFQMLISFCVQTLDTIMVGTLGDVAVSAVSLANQPFFIFNSLVFGVANGGAVLISQYWGKKDLSSMKSILSLMMKVSLIISFVYGFICFFFAEEVIGIFSKDILVVQEGIAYLRIVVFSYVLNALSNCYLASLKAMENVKISTFVFSISLLTNLLFNYLLIFGHFGMPKLGVQGAAVATIVARGVEVILCYFYNRHYEERLNFTYKDFIRLDLRHLNTFLKVCIPVILHELAWSSANSAQMAIIGNISSTFVAAVSISSVAQQLGMVFLQGVSSASAIMIGKSVGEGKIEQTHQMSKKFLKLSMLLGLCAMVLVFVLRGPLLSFYPNVSLETRSLASELILISAIIVFLIAIEYTCTVGILRGAGDTHFAFLVDSGCMWFIGIPLGFAAAYIFELPILLVFICLKSDSIFKIVLCIRRIYKGQYIKDFTTSS